ncbi:signal recognition particle protein [Iodidimonas sp. SYSU 1G8]|uniref:signal recognition particle protein n=1 Tax=Iodidimonas sp. SYSU 1G8 TaxID=3133967 RepID=UPI0031FE5F47
MFETLSGRLGDIFDTLRGRGVLNESDVGAAMREVRVALLEADVALSVVKDFVEKVRARAVGQEVLKSVTPGQMVVKIVNDELVAMLGGEAEELFLAAVPPVPIMMVGLQGSGKTTSTAKIAKRLTTKDRKRVLMASLDTRRPAAQEQLKILGQQINVATLPIIPGQMPLDIAKRAMEAGRLGGYDVVMLDTAGRLHVDEGLMSELDAVKFAAMPAEILLVADALTGQDAVNVAKQFNDRLSVTGIVLTRMDGDGRGGAALSMRAVTGRPIKLVGTGEKLDEIEGFHPSRVASRILGMGDVVSLVERAQEMVNEKDAEALVKRLKKGQFTLIDYQKQLQQMRKMGGMAGILGMLPGVGKLKKALAGANIDESMLVRQDAIINSMTARERENTKIIAASRKKRIAAGSGTSVQEVNKLLKQHQQMADMMKKMGKGGKGMQLPPGFDGLLPR